MSESMVSHGLEIIHKVLDLKQVARLLYPAKKACLTNQGASDLCHSQARQILRSKNATGHHFELIVLFFILKSFFV